MSGHPDLDELLRALRSQMAERRPPRNGAQKQSAADRPASSLRARRDAALRLEPLPHGVRDPLDHLPRIRLSQVTFSHLDQLGLCACWVTGGPEHRGLS